VLLLCISGCDEPPEGCLSGVEAWRALAGVGALSTETDSDACCLCRLQGNRDRFLGTTISGSGTLRFSAGGSDGRGRCKLTLVLFERGKESSKKPLELCVLRWPGVLRSPSRELLPSVLPSSSPLARASFTWGVLWRNEPPSDRSKGEEGPSDRSCGRPLLGGIEDRAGDSFGRCDIAARRVMVLDGHAR
jgi:hypothetical protein